MPSSPMQQPAPLKTQACIPCAKRKVRCDRREPCSNCRRRKHDRCIYVEALFHERIKKLEAQVRSLGGDPDGMIPGQEKDGGAIQLSDKDRDQKNSEPIRVVDDSRLKIDKSIIAEENGEPVYLEPLNGKELDAVGNAHNLQGFKRVSVLASSEHNALFSIIRADESVELSSRHPSRYASEILWDNFIERIHPMAKINFEWELIEMRNSILDGPKAEITNQKHSFLFALYLLSTLSLSDDECLSMLHQQKSILVAEFQFLCEQALARSNFLATADITCLQSLTMYIHAGLNRLNMKSLWSLMGFVLRSAERLGLHRDGTFLDLSPLETERRRRLWWQLQHVDVALSVGSGCSSLAMVADWDTKLPLNIEDDDIRDGMREPPTEREGLTGMSYCIWTYWILQEQRSFRTPNGVRLGLSWSSTTSISRKSKREQIEEFEDRTNKKFLQYCDPIKPLDLILQITSRMFISTLHRLTLHPQAFSSLEDYSESHRQQLLDSCIKCLEYYVALNSIPCTKKFQWRTKQYIPWSALVCILFEIRELSDNSKIRKIWALLSDTYAITPEFLDLEADLRRFYIAELVILAWLKHECHLLGEDQTQGATATDIQKPNVVLELEKALAGSANLAAIPTEGINLMHARDRNFRLSQEQTLHATGHREGYSTQPSLQPTERSLIHDIDFSSLAELKFDDINWSLWNDFDYNSMV